MSATDTAVVLDAKQLEKMVSEGKCTWQPLDNKQYPG
jgi:hypothetical protein